MSLNQVGEEFSLGTAKESTGKIKLDRVETRSKLFENFIEREWLATKEAAHFLSVTPNALRIMVHRDQIRAYKFGRRLRFKLDDCRALFSKKGA